VGAAAKSLRMAGGLQDAGAGSGARLSRATVKHTAMVATWARPAPDPQLRQ
jgi:hypothetical protein